MPTPPDTPHAGATEDAGTDPPGFPRLVPPHLHQCEGQAAHGEGRELASDRAAAEARAEGMVPYRHAGIMGAWGYCVCMGL